MAEAKAPTASYLPGEDAETLEANRRYQEALAKLTDSLDNRKNRFFDPTMLAMAQGFLAPTQTGGFGESLGNVAGKVGPAEAAALKEEQDLAQQKFAVAGQGLELQRLKARDAELSKYLNPNALAAPTGPLTGPGAAPISGPRAGLPPAPVVPSEAPVGGLSQAAAPAASSPPPAPTVVGSPQGALTAMESNKPPGYEGVEGIQVAPANPNFMTGRDYVRLNRYDKSKSPGDLIKEGQEIEQKRYRDKEGGVLDLASGKFYQFPTGKTEEIQLYGYPGTHKVDARTAAKLSMLAANDDPEYHTLAKRIVEGPRKKTDVAPVDVKPTDSGGKPTEAGGTPSVSVGAPSTSSGRMKSVQELALDAKIAERNAENALAIPQEEAITRARELGKASAAKEATLEETDATARRVYGNVTRVQGYLKQSGNYFGIFARPGVTAAIGTLIKEGIQTPSGTLSLAGFEDSMRQMMPGIKQKDLDNVTKAAAELAEVELAFTRLYLAKQGAVTEGERKIVRAIPGTVSSSPEVLRSRMELLKSRSQFDIDTADAFRQWQEKNPGRSYLEFERKSDLYKDIKKEFEAETERIFGGIKAVPTSQRKQEAAPAGTPAGTPSPGFIRDPVTGVIRKKKAGE
jgi:hypothetical protein